MDVTEVLLPGVGLRYEFTTAAGQRMAMVARRSGEIDLALYESGDPDECRELISLTPHEAEAVAEILGAPRIAERFADLTKEVPGLSAGQVAIGPGSEYDGKTLGDTRARTLTGASVVAIVRGDDVVASPSPAEPLRAGDVLVVIGTHEGIHGVERILGA